MQIPSLIWMLQLMNVSRGQGGTGVLRFKRSEPMSISCQAGCATCSLLNGCLSCKPRFFFHLELDGIQQRGTCMSSCPRGHYGIRSPHISTCSKCKADCASCFSENFCTRCHAGHFLFLGKCESSCPSGLTADAALRECTDGPEGCEQGVGKNNCTKCREDLYLHNGQCNHTCPRGFEPDTQLMQCIPQVHCEVGEWTSWGQCVRKQNATVHRRGEETRTRQILHSPSDYGDPCPHVSEIRKCATKKKQKSKSE